ncbi:Cellulose synthase-like protein E6 [Morus notabilis]|uniref:Cellulose synthase-like protein E6 n=2 Tax=Morus notabilis TaxID=981085 RepID=W9QQR6_9ROSA|nr:Cellulose synthase-like protein E6 [Morus notabilis]
MGKQEQNNGEAVRLFETREARFRGIYRVFASTIMVGICLIWFYRLKNIIPRTTGYHDDHQPAEGRRWAWIGMFMAEVGFGLYWIITQSVRWSLIHFYPFKERLSNRYENMLPGMDIFVCTADPIMEPPTLVINTVLSAMSYNYPPEKLSVYVSDDGGSEFTFYSLLEASHFSKRWIPFCKRFNIEPRAPEAYFSQHYSSSLQDNKFAQEWLVIKKLYEDMKNRIELAVEAGKVPEEARKQHKGFSEWNLNIKKNDHQPIVQILIDGRDTSEVNNEGSRLPTLVYMAREKRPNWPHNFKAGAMNALIRVSSEITNAPFILNLDCDMYSNNADTIQEILCFFMDEKKGDEFAFVQFPQYYNNTTKNDVYANVCAAANEVELAGVGGYGAALYCGTGCFHRRESLSGEKYSKGNRFQWNTEAKRNEGKSVNDLEKSSKVLASCCYEKGTQWGKEMGLMYGCPVEDIVTGLAIQCRGWKSVHYNAERKAFLGVAPTTLEVSLVQHKRWSEGMSQIFLSKYCPFIYGHGRIKLGAQMGYSIYLLWAPISLPVLFYVIVPSLCLLKGISLFPEVSSPWFLPFAYVFVAKNVFSALEAMNCGSTLKGWWNLQRMWLIRRTSSYFIAFLDIIKRKLGLSETTFALTDKVVTEDVSKRYEQEIMEFGSSSLMFTILATLALLNLFTLVGGIMKILMDFDSKALEQLILQIVLCGIIVVVNFPVYQALFIRRDKGCIPSSLMLKSVVLASLLCLVPLY